MHFGGGQENATAVCVTGFIFQPIRPRAYDATVDHLLIQIDIRLRINARPPHASILIVRQHGQILPMERGLKTIGKSDAVAMPVIIWSLDDNANASRGMDGLSIDPANFDKGDDLGSEG